MKILVTGAGGMVGRNILEHPAAQSHEMLAPRRSELDLSDRTRVARYLEQNRPDMIIHAAGRVGGIQANMAHPVEFLVENVDINRNLIGCAQETGIRRLINLGSSCMYPRAAQNPLREDMILTGELEPTNEGYALAKVMAMRLCQYIGREKPEMKYKTLIPCNLYGRHDKFDPKHSHLIPALIHKVHLAKLQGAETVEIWGDGTARREFMDAADLADLIFTVVNRFDETPDVMNVGLGFDHTINEYYEAVARVIGWHGRFAHDLTKPVGMKQKLVSVERLQAFGWRALTSLEDGIRKAYEFYLKEEHI